ncbi:MAG: LysM peptidoglycan-binding domain-containing protein [Cytophagales bacterium]|nr:LysM peptidoglycan-binding domain-containing protein [Cytophagales bacterium]
MSKFVVFIIIIFCNCFDGSAYSLYLSDSVGVTVKGEIKYVIHEVEAGETLFALSRKYKVDVRSIKNANRENLNNLSIGQRVLIPIPKTTGSGGGVYHTVRSSETLFSISRQYNVRVDDLKKWNNLSENSISVGQKLLVKREAGQTDLADNNGNTLDSKNRKTHVVGQSQTLYSISRMYGVSTGQLIEWNNLTSDALNIGQVLVVSASLPVTETASNSSMLPSPEKTAEKPRATDTPEEGKIEKAAAIGADVVVDNPEENYSERPAEKVIQKGIAEVIQSNQETKKYLALHRDAPIGTIMQVKNEMNNQSVFVRIVGTIPDTGDNSKVILKISKKAYDRLGAVDDRFPVELSYIP